MCNRDARAEPGISMESKETSEPGAASSGVKSKTLPHREATIGEFNLLVVEKQPGLYRLYVRMDGRIFCHYDSGEFRSIDEAQKAAVAGFDPTAFLLFPVTPLRRQEVLRNALRAFDSFGLTQGGSQAV